MPLVTEKVPLNNATLSSLPSTVEPLGYNRNESETKIQAGIMHFGVGAFHRSHQALYLDKVLANTRSTEWGLVGVGLLSFDLPMRDAMKAQDCLYTVNEMSPVGEMKTHVVQSMVDYIYGPDNFEVVVARLMDPAIRIVSLTITEGGYLMNNRGEFLRDHPAVIRDLENPSLPQSVFGIIIEALARRRKAKMDAFTIMSCDNLRHNGKQARKACLAFANARDPELANWIDENVTFPSAMVDRITPAMNAELRNSITTRSGVDDLAPVIAEDFTQWVLEDNFRYGRPAYETAGVTMTDDVTPYEEAKIRLLNGSHQMLSYPAFLSGFRRVDVALTDPLFSDYIQSFLDKDAGPWLQSIPGMELNSYKATLLQRFKNTAIGDQLARLCLDGGSKIPGFLLPSMDANLKHKGTCHRLAYLLACYNHYIHTKTDDMGQEFTLNEPNAMALLEPIIASNDPMTLLQSTHLVGDASHYPQFVKDYLACCKNIESQGARATLEKLETICQ
jgi:mannitol 2-dehydrogenase